MSSLPLEGIRVVDIGGWFTGPMAACMLGDQGAEVIKIEPPGGEVYRRSGTERSGMCSQWMTANRNKRFVQLDIKQPGDLDALKRLIAKADVLIHNTRPGAMARAGLDAATLRKEHPRLIHVSIAAYGQDGPFAEDPGFDTLFQGLSGLCYLQGGDRPKMINTLVIDKSTSPIVAQAVCAALFRRERTGEGATLEYSMLDGSAWWVWPDGMVNDTFIGDEGVSVAPGLTDVEMISETADGFMLVLPHMQHHWEAFCEIVGRPELLTREGFVTARERMGNLPVYFHEVVSSLKGKTTAEWTALFRAAGLPTAPVIRPEELANHPQAQHNGTIEIVEDELLGKYRSPRAPVRFDGEMYGTRTPPRPAGADTEAVLRDWGVERVTA